MTLQPFCALTEGLFETSKAIELARSGEVTLKIQRTRPQARCPPLPRVDHAPDHHRGPGVLAGAVDGNERGGTMLAHLPDQPAQMPVYLDAGQRLARPQHYRDQLARLGMVDMDWQETALVEMGIEQRQSLAVVNHLHRVVDVEDDALGPYGVAGSLPPRYAVFVSQRRRQLFRIARKAETIVKHGKRGGNGLALGEA